MIRAVQYAARISRGLSAGWFRGYRQGKAIHPSQPSIWRAERDMTERPWLSIILAAGLDTRMRSALPKVMHQIAGRPMVAHAAAAAAEAGAARHVVVIG